MSSVATTDASAQQGVWEKHARQWNRVGSPLRPAPEDGRLALALAQPCLLGDEEHRVAILGVTPELIQLPWSGNVVLQAYDHSAEMIASVWQPHPRIRCSVRQADWRSLPLDAGSIDAVLGDGSLNVMPDIRGIRVVLAEIARILKPTGRLVLRCFLAPEERESLQQVAAAALQGRIASFHALKWRVAMALPRDSSCSVAVAAIGDAFNDLFADRDVLARGAGWERHTIDTIDVYQGSDTRYSFPTWTDLQACSAPYFCVVERRVADYELAERCPTVGFRPLSA